MKLDRALQREMLEFLSDHYARLPVQVYPQRELTDEEDDKYTANLLYLEAHGLVKSGLQQGIDGGWSSAGAKITAAGLDFLADDGGLTAILGTVTIKLHEDTLLRLIEARMQSSDLPAEEKAGLMKSIRELPGDAIKHLTEKLIDAGLENWPVALLAIQTFLTHGPK